LQQLFQEPAVRASFLMERYGRIRFYTNKENQSIRANRSSGSRRADEWMLDPASAADSRADDDSTFSFIQKQL
jgi:hypothetical protein